MLTARLLRLSVGMLLTILIVRLWEVEGALV